MHHDLLLSVWDPHLLCDAGKLGFQFRSHFRMSSQEWGCLLQERLRQAILVGAL